MEANSVMVTGDFLIDHHLLAGSGADIPGKEGIGTTITETYGGAWLTYAMLERFIESLNKNAEVGNTRPRLSCHWPFTAMPDPGSSQATVHDSYLRWVIFEKDKKKGSGFTCRLVEKLGFGSNAVTDDKWLKSGKQLNPENYDIIVIDESFLGFRNSKESWPDFGNAAKIIFKTAHPLGEGMLWDELMKNRQKLITVVKLDQIKHYGIKVSNDISWEQTALDIVYGLNNDPTLKNLLRSGEVIITIGTAGAVYVKTDNDPAFNEYQLVFDPEYLEHEWEERYAKEIQNDIGQSAAFLSGLTSALMMKSAGTAECIKAGLNTMTASLVKGIYRLKSDLSLEIADLSEALNERIFGRYYSSAFIPSPAWKSGFGYLHNQEWSILENNYDNTREGYLQKSDFYPLAFALAGSGKNSLHFAPRLTLGRVTVFDRNEIENLRNIRKQVGFYDRYDEGKKPLNIAVFGPPGAGKSFIVKALANSMFEGKKTKPSFLTFNLSQFKDESELTGAFHAVRDEVLRGRLPIVFWDEFDSDDYRWLKTMIAPMQDGEFQEGKEVHPIGKCIFVFAGGVTYTMQHFCDKMESGEYAVKKGPDFQSRINCSLNVFGPNRKPYQDLSAKTWLREGDVKDICFSVRRALFIRSILGSDEMPLNIDNQLLRTLIEVSGYKNGSRGLERLLRNLAIHNNRKIEQSDLPSKEIIQMNVDYMDFMEKLSDVTVPVSLVFEKIAVAVHNSWLDNSNSQSVFHKKYEDLGFDQRMDNIAAARRMSTVIEGTGKFKLISEAELKSEMLPDAKQAFMQFIADEGELDKLAELEHNGWIQARKEANWTSGKRSDYHKTHDCMVPFGDLDKGILPRANQAEKNKDRYIVKKYADMLEGSGYTITFQQ